MLFQCYTYITYLIINKSPHDVFSFFWYRAIENRHKYFVGRPSLVEDWSGVRPRSGGRQRRRCATAIRQCHPPSHSAHPLACVMLLQAMIDGVLEQRTCSGSDCLLSR